MISFPIDDPPILVLWRCNPDAFVWLVGCWVAAVRLLLVQASASVQPQTSSSPEKDSRCCVFSLASHH
jgi:hypothetical protein